MIRSDPVSLLAHRAAAPERTISYGPAADQLYDVRSPGQPAKDVTVIVVHGGFWRPGYDRSHAGAQSAALAAHGIGAVHGAAASALGAIAPTQRIGGSDRYATAAAVSKATFANASTVYIASGLGFADALSGGPAAAKEGGPIAVDRRDVAAVSHPQRTG